jgi:hypothetical protein
MTLFQKAPNAELSRARLRAKKEQEQLNAV